MNKPVIAMVVVTLVILLGGVWLVGSPEDLTDDPNNPILSTNGIHYHPEVEIYIYGEKQDIPSDIGLVGGHSPVHTHDTDGIIHLEYGSGVVRGDDTRLGNFFEIWGKEFNSNQILDHVSGSDGTVTMTVNSELNTEFENYRMKDGDKIEIRFN
ncbi:MAG: hypothetical protein ACI9GH_000582 [Candidatus Paceibacteria bacterium]|jgi:hypothetical protein